MANSSASVLQFLSHTYWSIAESLPHEHFGWNNKFLWFFPSSNGEPKWVFFQNPFCKGWMWENLTLTLQRGDNFWWMLWSTQPFALPLGWLKCRLTNCLGDTSRLGIFLICLGSTLLPVMLPMSLQPAALHFSEPFGNQAGERNWGIVGKQIRKARSLQDHASAADKYLRHLAGQFADRKCYWELRHRASQRQDIIIGIQDSMDKSKFRLPRYSGGVVPKALEQKVRPECELTACIIHGRGIFIYVADPNLSFGSDWNLEVFSRSLESCWQLSQKNGSTWPRTAKLFSDNTPKDHRPIFFESLNWTVESGFDWKPCFLQEIKNSVFDQFCSLMTTTRCFDCISHEHLCVGHTHEDVGPNPRNQKPKTGWKATDHIIHYLLWFLHWLNL